MIRLMIVAMGLSTAVACTCSNNDMAEQAAAPAEANAKKAPKSPKAKRPEGDRAPVLRNGRFHIPLKSLGDANLEQIRAAINAAQAEVKREEDQLLAIESKPWKCRRTTVWPVVGDGAPNDLRLYERLEGPECTTDGKVEKWEANMRFTSEQRPAKKDQGGQYPFMFSGEQHDYRDGAWAGSFAAAYTLSSGRGGGAFAHEDSWLTERLPKGTTLGKKAKVDGHRWSVGVAMVAGEKVTVEGEAWTCRGKSDVVSAELIFRTNKRAAGHSPTSPKDVVVTEKVRAFGAKLVEELGDLVAGEGNTTAASQTCKE